jgi:C-8 sterol isomerase
MPRFDPQTVRAAALDALRQDLPLAARLEATLDALESRYPGLIDRTQPWIFSNAGGAMIQVKFLYASLTEYVSLFGTPVGTEGHSGRNAAEFHDTVLDGEAWYYHEGQLERTVYRQGDAIHVQRWEAAGMHIPDRVWMLEYCRGALPTLMPFGLGDSLFSTLDFLTAARTLRVYAVLLWRAFTTRPARR